MDIEISRLSREINESLELPAGLGNGNDSELSCVKKGAEQDPPPVLLYFTSTV